MIRIYVDFTRMGGNMVIIPLDLPSNSHIKDEELKPGINVTVYDEEVEYKAKILEHIGGSWWTAEIDPESMDKT